VSPPALLLEIVTPDGTALSESGVEVVVFHRREPNFEPGSEIAVFPLHGPMLARLAVGPLRYRKGGETIHLALGGGFAQILEDRVLIATPRVRPVPSAEANPHAAARTICAGWKAAGVDFDAETMGYP
jgi:F-type H+-transporting ATPase subunit epsilon